MVEELKSIWRPTGPETLGMVAEDIVVEDMVAEDMVVEDKVAEDMVEDKVAEDTVVEDKVADTNLWSYTSETAPAKSIQNALNRGSKTASYS